MFHVAYEALNFSQGYGNGEEACREDKEQRALHCPECMYVNHFTLTIEASYFFFCCCTYSKTNIIIYYFFIIGYNMLT